MDREATWGWKRNQSLSFGRKTFDGDLRDDFNEDLGENDCDLCDKFNDDSEDLGDEINDNDKGDVGSSKPLKGELVDAR